MDTPLVKAAFLFSESFTETIPQGAFTHIYLCIDLSSGYEEIRSRSDQITAFARTGVKLLLSIGGDSSIFGGESGDPSILGERRIINSCQEVVINLVKKLRLDGLDLRWLYPDTPEEMTTFGVLLTQLRNAMPPPLLLTATVFYKPRYRRHLEYPIKAIVETCDWINVMAFDLYTPVFSPKESTAPAPLFNESNSLLSGDYGVTAWIGAGVPAKKLVFGLPFYGRSWCRENVDDLGPFSANRAAYDVSDPIAYSRILDFRIENGAAKAGFLPSFFQEYCYDGRTWIGFDGEQSIPFKVRYAKDKKGLLGYFAWHVEADDTADWTLSYKASGAWDDNIST